MSMVTAAEVPTVVAALPLSQSSAVVNKSRNAGFNYSINAFRGICVLLVFFYHVFNAGLLTPNTSPTLIDTIVRFFAESWRYGVELFFMISGYVIVASLRRHRNVSAFLRDRCIRIFPVWIPIHIGLFSVGVMTGWKIFKDLNGSQLLIAFVANLLLIPPLLPIPVTHPASWSLSYEWLFYLIAAAAFALFSTKRYAVGKRNVLWLVWGAVTLSLLCLLPRGLFFLPGVIVACGWLSPHRGTTLLRWPLLSMVLFLFAWRLVGLDHAEPGAYSIVDIVTSRKIIYMLIAFFAGLHLFACVSADRGDIPWLRGRVMQFLGAVSYSFYLWHPLVMFAVKKVITTLQPAIGEVSITLIFATTSLVLSLLISWLSYRVIEQGLAKRLRKSGDQPKSVTLSADAFPVARQVRAEGG